MKRIIFSTLCLLLVAQLAYGAAAEVFVPGVGNKTVQGDVDGTIFSTERYPRTGLVNSVVLVNAVTVGAAATTASTGFPNTGQNLWIRILVVQGSGFSATANWFVRFKGSFDNVNYGYIAESASTSAPMQMNTAAGDTLQVKGAGLLVSPGEWINIKPRNGSNIPFPWVIAEFVNPTGSGGSVTLTLEMGYRGY